MNVMNDQDPSTFSPRADDVTTASAWSSSPLGDPADEAEYHPYRYNFPPDPITPAAGPKSFKEWLLGGPKWDDEFIDLINDRQKDYTSDEDEKLFEDWD